MSLAAADDRSRACLLCGHSVIDSLWEKMPSGIHLGRCRSCGLVYQPRPGDVASIYGDGYHTHWNEKGVADAKRDTYRFILDKLPWPAKRAPRVLDVGCAFGDSLAAIEDKGGEAWGVEFTQALGERLRARWGGRVSMDDFLNLPYEKNFFYAVGMIDVIEHFVDPVAVLKHSWEILEPGGWLFLATPDYGSLTRKLLGKYWEQFKPEHISYFEFRQLADACRRIGFVVSRGGNFRKKLQVGYLATTLTRHSPWIMPGFAVSILRRVPFFWNLQVWFPTDGFILLAQKPLG